MDNYRNIPGQDYGILRKKDEREEELFVFGYSCKIYEDYGRAVYVDQGKHLIPWLGDDSLKIDRYDFRGALHDLVPYLPKPEGFDRLRGLNAEEKRLERLCDEERYRALTTNEEEELHQEEEMKRLQKAINNDKSYSEIPFSYDDTNKIASIPPAGDAEVDEEEEDENEQFIPPYSLDVPVGMKIPKSKKHHEIIEKTALFISDQGAQMEILLKMKQANNLQFSFLKLGSELHPYYKHMLKAMKNGSYRSSSSGNDPSTDTSISEPDNEDTYLHPSLVPSSKPVSLSQSVSKIPNISYKPSEDCTYSVLVNRIKETQIANLNSVRSNLSSSSPLNANDSGSGSISPSNDSLPLSALTKSARRRRIRKEKNKAAVASFNIYYTDEQSDDNKDDVKGSVPVVEDKLKSNATSDSTLPLKAVPLPAPELRIPPPDVQLVIDKMASYVAKNGRDFEEVVRSKGDPRFSFLDKTHIYNAFYNQKVGLYLQIEYPVSIKPPLTVSTRSHIFESSLPAKKSPLKTSKSSRSSKPIPICFSIKKPKDQEALEIKSAFPYEENECEEGEHQQLSEENGENFAEVNEEESDDMIMEIDPSEITSPVRDELENVELPSVTKISVNLENWAEERLGATLVTAAKEKLAVKDKNVQIQAERRKRAAEFINLLQKENLIDRAQTPEVAVAAPIHEALAALPREKLSNDKKESSDVITILSDSSSDSESIVSIPLSCSSEVEKEKPVSVKKKKRKRSDSHSKRKQNKKKDHRSSSEAGRRPSKHHRSYAASVTHSPLQSRHSSHSKYKKHDKEKSSRSKKKKRHHSYKDSHSKKVSKSKRPRYSATKDEYKESDKDNSSSGSGSNSGPDANCGSRSPLLSKG